jgi:hypothetical protein
MLIVAVVVIVRIVVVAIAVPYRVHINMIL